MNTNEYFDPEDTVGCPIWDANLAINTEFSDHIAQHGVLVVLWRFLRALSERDGLTSATSPNRKTPISRTCTTAFTTPSPAPGIDPEN